MEIITYQLGLPDALKKEAALLYATAFEQKFIKIIGNKAIRHNELIN